MSGQGKLSLFGTDGIRGTANVYPMTAEMALSLGQAVAHVFRGGRRGKHRILIGKDTRLSGYLFENALAAGVCAMGVDVIQVGPMPTPAMAFLTADMRCDAGIERFPQLLVNVRVAEKRPIDEISSVCEAVRRVEKALDGRGRVLIRYSGTEPKARVMVEGEDESRVGEYANEIADSLRRALGAA